MKCPKCHHENPEDILYCGKCGTQLPSLKEVSAPTETIETPKEELTTGSTFADRYQIIEELGKGGMGKIYKVLDTKIKEKIALKLLKPEIASDKNTMVFWRLRRQRNDSPVSSRQMFPKVLPFNNGDRSRFYLG